MDRLIQSHATAPSCFGQYLVVVIVVVVEVVVVVVKVVVVVEVFLLSTKNRESSQTSWID